MIRDNRGQAAVIGVAVIAVMIVIAVVFYISWRGFPIGSGYAIGSPRAEVDVKVTRGFTGVSVKVLEVHVDRGLNFSLWPFIMSAEYKLEVTAYNHDTGNYLSSKTVPGVVVDINGSTTVNVKWLDIDNCRDIDFKIRLIYTKSGATEASTTYEYQW